MENKFPRLITRAEQCNFERCCPCCGAEGNEAQLEDGDTDEPYLSLYCWLCERESTLDYEA